ncbi:MAG: RagB/SusD family nutrient uptake outer membrane protein [Bacteroidetes bacterium]|nr:RagB/SusD family nutrient uptake outer membrane protein [Bacteroidota bacterium]
MKNIHSIIFKSIGIILFSFIVSSCSDAFLELPPESNLTDGDFYQNDAQIQSATATLYNLVWFDYNDKASYNLGDFRGGSTFDAWSDRDNVEFKTTPDTPDNGVAWRSFYNVVGQANTTMYNIINNSGPEVTERMKEIAIGECRFMRALAYEHLVMNWGAIPIIENNLDLLDNPLSVRRNTITSVWEFITRDYLAAAEALPETSLEPGRLNRWAAEGMLARTYLTRAGVESTGGMRVQDHLDKAKMYAKNVIEMSGASLLPNYGDLFNFPYDNNSESLFSLQWAFASGEWGSNNSVTAYLTPFAELGNGDGWGGAKGATFWILSLYEGFEMIDENTLEGRTLDSRLHATFMMPGAYYPDLPYNNENGDIVKGFRVPDPQADLGNTEFAHIKKYVVGRLGATQATSQHYSHDTYMLRLAEMYLIYAEAEMGNNTSTSDGLAVEYFNIVHSRATGQTLTEELTAQILFEERAKEFAGEARMWYDLVRLHYYNPDLAYQIVSTQDRGLYSIQPDNPLDPTSWTIQKISWDNNRNFSASSGNFQLPLPANEVSSAPNLLEEPEDYQFN